MRTLFRFMMCLIGGLGAVTVQADTPANAAAPAQEIDVMSMERDAKSGLILINAVVNNTPMRCMLDTGANRTILHHESALKLKNVQWLSTAHLKFDSNSTQRPKMLVANLQAGPGISPRHVFAVLDLSSVHSMMAEKIDGIIGMDVLGSLPFTFDFRKNEFYWGIPQDAALSPVYGKMENVGRMMVHPKCGSKQLNLLLDTGSVITKVPAADWEAGSAGEISAHMGNVDSTQYIKVEEGKPADLEVAPGVLLRGVQPILCKQKESALMGLDAMKDAVLIHLPTEESVYGQFFFTL